MENKSVPEQINRGLFLAPSLIGSDEESPLLERAKRNVEATAKRAAAKKPDERHPVEAVPSDEVPTVTDSDD